MLSFTVSCLFSRFPPSLHSSSPSSLSIWGRAHSPRGPQNLLLRCGFASSNILLVMAAQIVSLNSPAAAGFHRCVSFSSHASGPLLKTQVTESSTCRCVPSSSPSPNHGVELNGKVELKMNRRRDVLFASLLPLWLINRNDALADQIEEDENKEIERKEAVADTFGFDGLGTNEADYAVGKVVALAQAGDGAVLFLGVDGFDLPLRMVVGAAEAMAILTAAQERRSRRPVTHEAWSSSLAAVGWKVDRVTITSMESDVFYSRLVLSLEPSSAAAGSLLRDNAVGDGLSKNERFRSVDMRPSDAIALALRCRAPLFISKKVAEEIVGAFKKGGDEPATRPSDPLKTPGLQARTDGSAVDDLSNVLVVHGNLEGSWRDL